VIRRLVLAGVAVVAIAAVAAYILVHRSTKATPATAPAVVQAALAPGVLPRPGVYVYAQTGYEKAKLGPLTIRRTFPATALFVVSGTGHVVQTEWRYSKQHLEASRDRVTPTGSYTLWQRTRLQLIVTDDEAHDTHPVTLSLPAHLQIGEAWTQRYSVNGITTVSRNRIVRRTKLDGKVVFVETADSVVSGAHPGTERDVDWIDPTTGLDLRETIDRQVGGAFPYEMHVDDRFLRKR
jgi:hypothetical protein